MTFIIIIVAIIIVAVKNKNLIEKNSKLQKEIDKYKMNKYCPHCGKLIIIDNCNNYNNNINNIIENKNIQINTNQNSNNNDDNKKEKTFVNSKEIKNSLILITGSILIIISSILFLISTWYSINNIIKTLVIVLVLIVFFISSHIADKYLNLKQTSKAFFYIALTYIPISLLSIALFELFGKYLSLYGLGKYIYLSVSSLIVAIIYYYFANEKESKFLAVSSYIFQLLTIILGTLIFSESFKIVIINLCIYNIIFEILFEFKKYYFNRIIHIVLITIFIYIFGSISTILILKSLFNNFLSFIDIAIKAFLLINLYIYLNKNTKNNNIYNYIYPIIILTIFYDLSFVIGTKFIFKQLFILLAIVFICLYDILKNNKISLSNFIELSISIFILYISSLIYHSMQNALYIKGFIILIIYTLFSLLNYIINDNNKLFNSYTFAISLSISIIGTIYNLELPLILIGFSLLIIVIISVLLDKIEINMRKTLNIIGNIFIWLFTFILIFSDINQLSKLAFIFVYTAYSILYSIVNKKDNYRIVSYIYFNILLFIFIDYLKIDCLKYIIPFTNLITYGIENYVYKNKEYKSIKIYLLISFIVSFIILLCANEILSLILLIFTNIIFSNFIKDYKLSNKLTYISYLTLIPYIYGSGILIFNNINYMYIISLIIIIYYIYKIYNDKKNRYIILYYIYSFMHITSLEEIKYVGIIILLIGTYVIYLIKDNKVKDIFKGICYTLLLILYKNVVGDLKLENYAIFNMGIYIVYLLVLIRDILRKYIKDYKVLEYIASSLIYLITLFSYNNELDGLLFVGFIVIIVMICYIYKFGPLLIVSLITIVINVLLLTREFWLSIPWWIYILLIGTLLVSFAIYNEIKLKKNNNIKEKLKQIKDDIDA